MTAQIGEILILEGERMHMTFCPPLPWHNARLRKLTPEEVARRIEVEEAQPDATGARPKLTRLGLITGSTACWRRYQGTWELRDGKLYLVLVAGRVELAGDEPLLADWFTGVLRIPRGDRLTYVHMGFGSVYEEEIHIRIERGQVTGRRVWDNRGRRFDENRLALDNLPGGENRFPGDDAFDNGA